MSVKLKLVSSFSTPHFHSKQTIKLSSRLGLFDTQCCKKNNSLFTDNSKVTKSCQLHQRLRGKEILSKRQHILFAASGDSQSTSDLETDEFELEMQQPLLKILMFSTFSFKDLEENHDCFRFMGMQAREEMIRFSFRACITCRDV